VILGTCCRCTFVVVFVPGMCVCSLVLGGFAVELGVNIVGVCFDWWCVLGVGGLGVVFSMHYCCCFPLLVWL